MRRARRQRGRGLYLNLMEMRVPIQDEVIRPGVRKG
jgi:hypothetical protein